MDVAVERVCGELEEIIATITAWGEERTFTEAFGWNTAPLTKQDLVLLFSDSLSRLKFKAEAGLQPELVSELPNIEARLRTFRAQNLPQLLSNNSTGVVGPVALLLNWLRLLIEPGIDWQTVPADVLPQNLRRRLRAASSSLAQLEPDIERLNTQIVAIKEAHDAALALPTDLQSLQEANDKVAEVSSQSAAAAAEIGQKKIEATNHLKEMEASRKEAEKTIQLVQQAYAAATSSGLAAAFDERSRRFTISMWGCVGGLVLALTIGSYIGSTRITALSYALTASDGSSLILTELLYSILSVGAPLWFAWLMTKQIGQRFRLAEDYGYKASVARAYEGFRREAVRIDPAFEARLFATALTRLEEPPLRLVETVAHGSPYQELISSEPFRRAMELVPELKDQFIGLAKTGLEKVKATKPVTLASDVPAEPKT